MNINARRWQGPTKILFREKYHYLKPPIFKKYNVKYINITREHGDMSQHEYLLYSQRLDTFELSDIVNKVTHFAHYVLKKTKSIL